MKEPVAASSLADRISIVEATASVKAHAIRLGFDAVRITDANPPGYGEMMAGWLDAEMHGSMGYLRRHEKLRAGSLDSPNLLADTRSVIMVAQSYHFPDENNRPTDTKIRGTVARYARDSDYHDIFHEKLRQLAGGIAENYPDTRTRGVSDSAPIRERELARRCGLGWQGKHTNLISLDLGNWFLLGALLTTLKLLPDSPVDDHCGTCTRCIAACPTGAILAPYVLDARRCISYLTIELKASIPLELRPLIGDRIFGCDDCLAACPWNERAIVGQETRLAARDSDAAFPDLLVLLKLLGDETAFKERFRGTPLLRPGRAGLRRNVCVALGNVGGSDALAALVDVVKNDPSEMVREHAVWAIERIENRL